MKQRNCMLAKFGHVKTDVHSRVVSFIDQNHLSLSSLQLQFVSYGATQPDNE